MPVTTRREARQQEEQDQNQLLHETEQPEAHQQEKNLNDVVKENVDMVFTNIAPKIQQAAIEVSKTATEDSARNVVQEEIGELREEIEQVKNALVRLVTQLEQNTSMRIDRREIFRGS
eukprot:gb/GECH01012833.1/.p1 GENE.gb/GECH01012833.1/~~gb/GECH01012833.1/.p1  ORF type:complete len:118 (+),score=12.28 gb/GECH01012833.1/:1-354(+)